MLETTAQMTESDAKANVHEYLEYYAKWHREQAEKTVQFEGDRKYAEQLAKGSQGDIVVDEPLTR
jgi:hypothetical protein